MIDPLNRLDHNPLPGQTETQYLSNLLNKFSEFATQYNCLVVVVAHPRKMNRNLVTNTTPRVEMYDISGSADFYNTADLIYDPVNGRYLPCQESHDPAVPVEKRISNTVYDSSCWLPEKDLLGDKW